MNGLSRSPRNTMHQSRLLTSLLLSAALVLTAFTAASCEVTVTVDEDILDALTCDLEFDGDIDATYDAPAFDYLLEATGHLNSRAWALQETTRAACNAFGASLGVEAGADAETACTNARTAAEAILAANADADITAGYTSGGCSVEADVAFNCAASCDATFDIETTPLVCEGGTISGTCEGSCSGHCTVEIDAACEETCYGSCSGDCTVTAADGSCAGTCEGVCQGSCSTTVDAACTGMCSGSCDVTWEAPRCEGGTIEVEADVNCEAACEAEASFAVVCAPPVFEVAVTGTPSDAEQMDMLAAAVADSMPQVIAVREEAEYVVAAALNVAAALDDATDEALSIGLTASVCLVSAVSAQVDAVQAIEASVSMSIEVEASVSATVN
jgi:hypothetical protein